MRYDCDDLIDDAQKIGELIITTPLKSLGNRRTIDFGSWNNADEDKAREIAEVAKDVSQVPQLPNGVDASHLLAGATMAVYANPDAFSKINEFLNAALPSEPRQSLRYGVSHECRESQMKAKETTNAAGKLPSQTAHPLAGAAAGARPRVERRLAAALALDIVDYSLMIGDDDEGTHQRVGKALARVNRQVRRFEGNVVSFSGDGLMAVFPSSRAALQCGIGIQKWMRDRNIKVEPKQRIIFRLGIHAGELVFQGWCASGDPLNIAARLERICQPGEICISATLLDQAEQVPGISLESMGAHKLKNIRQPVQVYRVTLADPVEAGALDVRTLHNLARRKYGVVNLRSPCCPWGMLVETQAMHILQTILSKALSRY